MMRLLGIETSCDETSAAIVENGGQVLSNVIASSIKEHSKYGGIIPEIASRRQLDFIIPVVEQALAKAGTRLDQADAIAVTQSPGLTGSLLVGLSFARALSFIIQKPLVEVNHIKAHIYANFLQAPSQSQHPKLPAIGLIVSGGHTCLYLIKNFTHFELLGETLDDAAGEAFDKVAKILGLGYPGGPVIDRISKHGRNQSIWFNPSELHGSYNFSFSGVKTAVLYHTQKHRLKDLRARSEVAFSFQDSVISILCKKCLSACREYNADCLLIGGGVAANSYLREKLAREAPSKGISVFFPSLEYCLDNAAMIAGYGYHLLKSQSYSKKRRRDWISHS